MSSCIVCGKEAKPTAFIDGMPYCMECARKIEDIIDAAIVACLEEYMATGKITKLDKVLPPDEEIEKLKLKKQKLKRIILTRVASIIFGRR